MVRSGEGGYLKKWNLSKTLLRLECSRDQGQIRKTQSVHRLTPDGRKTSSEQAIDRWIDNSPKSSSGPGSRVPGSPYKQATELKPNQHCPSAHSLVPCRRGRTPVPFSRHPRGLPARVTKGPSFDALHAEAHPCVVVRACALGGEQANRGPAGIYCMWCHKGTPFTVCLYVRICVSVREPGKLSKWAGGRFRDM